MKTEMRLYVLSLCQQSAMFSYVSPDPGNPTVHFHGEQRRNDTHESTTDPEAQLARKSSGHEAKLAYCGNVLIENRNGLGLRGWCHAVARRSARQRCVWLSGSTASSA
jgi:hypothetical protein